MGRRSGFDDGSLNRPAAPTVCVEWVWQTGEPQGAASLWLAVLASDRKKKELVAGNEARSEAA